MAAGREAMHPPRKKASIGTARFIPIFLAAIVTYTSYVITGPLVVDYLINPPEHVAPRVASGIAIVIVHYLLLLPVAATWLRILTVVWRDPGYVPLNPPHAGSGSTPAPGLEEFYQRDVFVCGPQGYPIWCEHCNAWKPDRSHHNQDVGRCTLKMDHFCPWVGGVVGERSFKFFFQFNFYSFLLAGYTMSVVAFFVAEKRESGTLEVQWLVCLGLAAFFTFFTMGMLVNSFWMVMRNVTTIENIHYFSRTMLLAVLLPPELQGREIVEPPQPAVPPQAHVQDSSPTRSRESERPLTSDIDDPSHSVYFSNIHSFRPPRRSSVLPWQDQIWKGTITYPLQLPTDRPPLPAPPTRTFAILETLPGMNPWDMGTIRLNLKSVFGEKLHHWLLPVRHSPCCDHASSVSQYPLGPDFEELLIEAGLMPRPAALPPPEKDSYDVRSNASRKRKRVRRLDAGWKDGERPDGWWSEKEARRLRHEARRWAHDAPGRDVVR